MSAPGTEAEQQQARLTLGVAGPADNLVSTACPNCGTRFAMLANYSRAGWHLLCTVCGWHGKGSLK